MNQLHDLSQVYEQYDNLHKPVRFVSSMVLFTTYSQDLSPV